MPAAGDGRGQARGFGRLLARQRCELLDGCREPGRTGLVGLLGGGVELCRCLRALGFDSSRRPGQSRLGGSRAVVGGRGRTTAAAVEISSTPTASSAPTVTVPAESTVSVAITVTVSLSTIESVFDVAGAPSSVAAVAASSPRPSRSAGPRRPAASRAAPHRTATRILSARIALRYRRGAGVPRATHGR